MEDGRAKVPWMGTAEEVGSNDGGEVQNVGERAGGYIFDY